MDSIQKKYHIVLPSEMSSLSIAEKQIAAIAETHSLSEDFQNQLSLVLEEVITNIVKYAYSDPSQHYIEIDLVFLPDIFRMVFSDNGISFDPTSVEKPDLEQRPEERKIGGLGIVLVRNIMDSVNYRRINHRNVLIMEKKIKKI